MIPMRRLAAVVLLAAGATMQACDSGPSGPRTGSLTVNIPNLPADVPAAVTVQGEVGTPAITVTSTRTIADLDPGIYTVTAVKAVGEKASYSPGTLSQTVDVTAGSTPATVSVAYTLATGLVNVTVEGIPPGGNASVTLFNNAGFFVNLTATREVGNLEPGEYSLQVDPVTADELYAGPPSPATFSVTASTTPVQALARYTAVTGSIQFSSSGLPTGAVPTWDISGPSNYASTVRGTGVQTLSRLAPGDYAVTARNFDFGSET